MSSVKCPLCRHTASRFALFRGRSNARCPNCRALERHRLDWLFFARYLRIRDIDGCMLHMAPERAMKPRFSKLPRLEYISGDIRGKAAGADRRVDVHRIPFPTNKFQVIYASHVLEHVEDDLVAMREFCRVLDANGGSAVLQVPLLPNRMTYRNVYAKTPAARKKHHGQNDHLRWYGNLDYHLLLTAAGFNVEIVPSKEFISPGEYDEFGLRRNSHVYLCRKNVDLVSRSYDSAA